uniref:Uncharacterized protein n=1 Tax=Rhizophora mucronata TaxID=61149 RepID=A0A2P2P6C8_RHIMU
MGTLYGHELAWNSGYTSKRSQSVQEDSCDDFEHDLPQKFLVLTYLQYEQVDSSYR